MYIYIYIYGFIHSHIHNVICLWRQDTKYPGMAKTSNSKMKIRRDKQMVYDRTLCWSSSGQHESYGQTSSTRLRSFLIHFYLVVSRTCTSSEYRNKCNMTESNTHYYGPKI